VISAARFSVVETFHQKVKRTCISIRLAAFDSPTSPKPNGGARKFDWPNRMELRFPIKRPGLGVWNIWWVSIKDGKQEQLTDFDKLNVYVRYPAWLPLGNQIVFEYAEMTSNIWMMELK
jgi:hypothetical protein